MSDSPTRISGKMEAYVEIRRAELEAACHHNGNAISRREMDDFVEWAKLSLWIPAVAWLFGGAHWVAQKLFPLDEKYLPAGSTDWRHVVIFWIGAIILTIILSYAGLG